MLLTKVNVPFILLLVLLFFTSCNGQVKRGQADDSVVKNILWRSNKTKLTKTQKSDEYCNVYCSLQDKAGNTWFGTSGEGVYKYDGKEFTQFTVQNGLGNNAVFSLLEDKKEIFGLARPMDLAATMVKALFPFQ